MSAVLEFAAGAGRCALSILSDLFESQRQETPLDRAYEEGYGAFYVNGDRNSYRSSNPVLRNAWIDGFNAASSMNLW